MHHHESSRTVLIGELDIDELTVLFDKMGMELLPRRVQELMVQFDVDQGGFIEFNEYLMMLNAISKDADDRIKEIIESPIMALKSNNNNNNNQKEQQQQQQYLPPRKGKLKISIVNSFAKKKRYRVVSSADKDCIQAMMKDVQGATAVKMINNSLTGAKLRIGRFVCMCTVYTPLSYPRLQCINERDRSSDNILCVL